MKLAKDGVIYLLPFFGLMANVTYSKGFVAHFVN